MAVRTMILIEPDSCTAANESRLKLIGSRR